MNVGERQRPQSIRNSNKDVASATNEFAKQFLQQQEHRDDCVWVTLSKLTHVDLVMLATEFRLAVPMPGEGGFTVVTLHEFLKDMKDPRVKNSF